MIELSPSSLGSQIRYDPSTGKVLKILESASETTLEANIQIGSSYITYINEHPFSFSKMREVNDGETNYILTICRKECDEERENKLVIILKHLKTNIWYHFCKFSSILKDFFTINFLVKYSR